MLLHTPGQPHQQKEIGVRTLLQNIRTIYSVLGVLSIRETLWPSLERDLGVLARRGPSMRVLLQLAMGEASGGLLALRAGSRRHRTRGNYARSSRTTGPGALLRAARAVCSAVPQHDILFFASGLFRAVAALSLAIRQCSLPC